MYSSKNIAFVLTSLEAIEKLTLYTKDVNSAEEFLNAQDQLIYNACQTLLMVIGEETKKIDNELLSEYPSIPWRNIKGLRDRIAHDYRGLDPTIPYSVIKTDLEPLRVVLVEMIDEIDYPREKLLKVLESNYYKHIGYLKANK